MSKALINPVLIRNLVLFLLGTLISYILASIILHLEIYKALQYTVFVVFINGIIVVVSYWFGTRLKINMREFKDDWLSSFFYVILSLSSGLIGASIVFFAITLFKGLI